MRQFNIIGLVARDTAVSLTRNGCDMGMGTRRNEIWEPGSEFFPLFLFSNWLYMSVPAFSSLSPEQSNLEGAVRWLLGF